MDGSFFTLKSFEDLNVLQEIQESFSIATGLASVLADVRGVHIGPGTNFSAFCNKIRSRQEGCDSCTMSNYIAASIARKNRKPFIYKCHSGLIDMVVPIIVNSQYIGSMLAGQIKCNDEEFPAIKKMPARFKWQEDPEMIQEYAKIEILPRKKIEAAANTLFVMVNYIIEKSIKQSIQEKLYEKNELLLKEIESKHRLEKSLKEAELKALQHQINPHFLYNVLNIINRSIFLGELNKAQEVLSAFTKMLRYSAKDIENTVTLQQELDYIEKYLFIQHLRFGERVKYLLDIEPELLNMQIPCFTLQPLVENAIVHGLEPKELGGVLKITAKSDSRYIYITIEDNGLGMPAEMLSSLKNLHFDKSPPTGIGFRNVYTRLKLFFGDCYSFDIDSQPNGGTKIRLSIPNNNELACEAQ